MNVLVTKYFVFQLFITENVDAEMLEIVLFFKSKIIHFNFFALFYNSVPDPTSLGYHCHYESPCMHSHRAPRGNGYPTVHANSMLNCT